MLSTRTIGGKLTCGLASLFALLVLFGVTSVLSLRAHSRMISKLETSVKDAPHRGDLIETFATLVGPLVLSEPGEMDSAKLEVWAKLQKKEFDDLLGSVVNRVDEIRRQLDKCGCPTTGSTGRGREMSILFDGFQLGFKQLEGTATGLGDMSERAKAAKWMLPITFSLIDQATRMPDPAAHLLTLLEEAQADHYFYAWIALIFEVAAISLVVALAVGGYFWILKPLRTLNADFDRVAYGEYSHRAIVSTRDEIYSLATAFNSITTKFQDVLRNQNDQIQMQAQKLLQSERVAGVGFLATGVAHEINNPLGVIAICADSIARQFTIPAEQWKPADFAEGREYSQMICNETQRCQSITHRMLDFAHGSSGEKNFYDVTAIVREVVELVGHLGKYNDRKIVFDNSHPCEAWVCGQEIRQAILNLVANALQAMSPGGVLRISLNETADQVDLSFQDDGCGMTPETLQQLFEPFFTTKDAGQGTGLGLSLTRKIIESHDGSISANSAGPGQGSTFRVRLPRAATACVRAA